MNQPQTNWGPRVERLRRKANEVRNHVIDMVYAAKSGHPGGSLSVADLIAVLYFDVMQIDPANPRWADRDRFILSKGHACPAWYACLAMRGYFPLAALGTLRRFESILQGHPDMRKTPGIDMTTGSLGHGLSAGVGIALEGRLLKKDYHVFVILGDGELDEGQVWEAAAAASKYALSNLVAVVDANKLQMDGFCADIMPLGAIDRKFASFGWEVLNIDGHDIPQILRAFEYAKEAVGRPVCIVADTVKGKGVSYMENVREWHGKVPSPEQYEQAKRELAGGVPCR
ncbi:MAG: transketolase [Kiritimatiellae bacterium]|nr:transketolase [Kiritimatiellia bacterium]